MPLTANQVRYMTTTEIRNCIVAFAERLDTNEKLAGTPTITSTAGLTITNKAVSDSVLTVEGESVAVGEAVTFTLGASAAGNYTITLTCDTDSDPAQTLTGYVLLIVR